MKRGDILKNEYVSKENSHRYSIYTGDSGQFINVIYEQNGEIRKGKYYKSDVVGVGKSIYTIRESDVLKRIAELVHNELLKVRREED